jgi:hypothetical protein
MKKFDPKSSVPIDVLVLGEHPSAYVTAALLRADPGGRASKSAKAKPRLRVVHATLPDDQPADRLVIVNPALFDLHPLLAGVGKGIWTTPVHGVRFLANDAGTASEYRAPHEVVQVARYGDLRDAVAAIAATEGVEFITATGGANPAVTLHRADETGLDATVGGHAVRATALVLANRPPVEFGPILGLPDGSGPGTVHRFTSVRCKGAKHLTSTDKQVMPMSLDLNGDLCWGWLLPGDNEFQLAVEQTFGGRVGRSGAGLLADWVGVLQRHGVLNPKFSFDPAAVTSVDLPLAGALDHEGVANRTVLVGPAGGFYSACGEDVYPACWSAVFAADVLRKSLGEKHLQDALADFRQIWRTTLGDYLRGPQQNLRLLLPLVYRNAAMTARLAEAILLSKSVVR